MPATVVTLRDGTLGRGEAAGVYYLDDERGTHGRQIEAVRGEIEAGARSRGTARAVAGGRRA